MLRLVKLEAFAQRLPRHLSGGQQQRVALGRALAIQPRVLLLDEPLSNLDAALRQEMAREIRILQQTGSITTIMVTHDQTEALAMADRLVVMHEGRVQQIGTPEEVHNQPANPFVARFIGGSNLVTGRLDADDRLVLSDGSTIALAGQYTARGEATLAVRPDSLRLAAPGTARLHRRRGRTVHLAWLGRGTRGADRPQRHDPGARPGPWRRCDAAAQCRHARHAALGGGGRTAVRFRRSRNATATGQHQGDQSCVTPI